MVPLDGKAPAKRPGISRLACDPGTVSRRDDWPRGLLGFLAAYRGAGAPATADDLLTAVRVWLCYTATSTYPFDELAGGRALLPEKLRAYVRDRQDAVVAVLADLDTIEAAVHARVSGTGR